MNKKFDTFYKLTTMVSIIIIIIILYRCCCGNKVVDLEIVNKSVVLIEPLNCTIENAPIYSKNPNEEELEYMKAFSDCYDTLNLPYDESDLVIVPEPKPIYLFIIVLVFIIGMAIRFKK